MTNIVNVENYLAQLGELSPSGAWAQIKSKEPVISLLTFTDEAKKDYLPQNSLVHLRAIYEQLNGTKTAAITVNGIGFSSKEDLKRYLSDMLRSYKAGQSVEGANRAFLSDLLSRNTLVVQGVKAHGAVLDIAVATKEGFKGNFFQIVFMDGKKQHIAIGNYLEPAPTKLINIWNPTKLK